MGLESRPCRYLLRKVLESRELVKGHSSQNPRLLVLLVDHLGQWWGNVKVKDTYEGLWALIEQGVMPARVGPLAFLVGVH